MAEIRWTREAEDWLRNIHDYIAVEKPVAAVKVIENIYEHVQLLRKNPNIGYKYNRYPEHNIRILLYGHYRIAYLVKKNGDIEVLGVFHGALDIEKYFS